MMSDILKFKEVTSCIVTILSMQCRVMIRMRNRFFQSLSDNTDHFLFNHVLNDLVTTLEYVTTVQEYYFIEVTVVL